MKKPFKILTKYQENAMRIALEGEFEMIMNPKKDSPELDELVLLLSEHVLRIVDMVLFETAARDRVMKNIDNMYKKGKKHGK